MTVLFLILISSIFVPNVFAWSNGGYSDDPSISDYGTHDWIAQHALDWLPSNEKEYIENNLATYLYGTELPDNGQASDGIGDTFTHHVYFYSDGTLQDDSSGFRASEEYNVTLSYLNANDFANAAKHAGIMTHYIADVAVFGHVMGSSTYWGAEQHHSDYENYVNSRTNSYDDDFNTYLSYDGSLDTVTAYDAAVNLAYDTAFDVDGDLACVWMDQHYDWSNSVFKDRCGESLNLAVNYLTDVLHTLYTSRSNATGLSQVVINEFELNPSGNDNDQTVLEWVELYNPTASSIDIGGWILSTTQGTTVTITIPSSMTIEANGYYVYERGQQWLDNTDESIILKNSSGVEIDRTPIKSDEDNDNYCWARFPNGYDTDSNSDWSFQSATKGASNGRVSSSINCVLSSTSLEIGSSITISGTITPSRSGVVVNLSYTMPNGTAIETTTTLNASGGYSDTYTPSATGSWSVYVSWRGDNIHEGATSSSASFTVSKISSTISCSISSTFISISSSLTVSGSITPARSGVTVTLSYTMPNATVLERTVASSSDGKYSDTYNPSVLGSWSVKASWEGDSTYAGAMSSSKSFTVSKISSSISCSVSSSSLTIGVSITVSGSITPARSDVTVTISYKSDGSWNTLATVTSASDGSYSYSWTPASEGSYQVKASWEGDNTYSGATSSAAAVSVTVAKISTTISCSVSPSEVTEGSSVTVSGSISPALSGKTVTLTYEKTDRTPPLFTRTVTTGSDGSYSDVYKPDATGSWSVSASWEGDSTHDSSTSLKKSFTVKKKGICLIATATYGSELSPEVQFLRVFRDNTVLTTFAGSCFMTVFNGFYYSISPSVASTISGNEALRGVMQVILCPLMGILHLSSAAFSLFSFNPEVGVVMAGLVASSLISVVYVMPWVLLFSFLKKFKPSTGTIRLTGLIWASSVVAIALAEATASTLLMMASTGAFLLATMCLATLATARAITRRYIRETH